MAKPKSEGKDAVTVEISPDGVTIIKEDLLAWSSEYDWDEVETVQIETTQQNLLPSEKGENGLPLSISRGQIRLGSLEKGDERTLSDYQESEEDRSFWTRLERQTGIVYEEDDDEINFPDDKSANQSFRDFIDFMVSNEYITESDLPWKTPRAQKNYVLNTEPKDQRGNEMPSAVETQHGVYFDEKTSRAQKERHVRLLVEEFADI